MALVDTWVTHNFISTSEIAKLGLKLPKDDSKLKGVNSQAHETNGFEKNVAIQMGDWNGMIDFLSVPFSNFNFILVTASFRGPR